MQYQISIGEDRNGVRAARVDIVDTTMASPGSVTWSMLEEELRETIAKSPVTMVGFDLSRLETLPPRDAFSLFEIGESLRPGYDICFVGPGPGLAALNERHEGPRLSPVIDPDAWDEHFGKRDTDPVEELFLVDLDDELRHIEQDCDPRDRHRSAASLEFVHEVAPSVPEPTWESKTELIAPMLRAVDEIVDDLPGPTVAVDSAESGASAEGPSPATEPDSEIKSTGRDRSPVVWESAIEAILDHGRRAARAPVDCGADAPPVPSELASIAAFLAGPDDSDAFAQIRRRWQQLLRSVIRERVVDLDGAWEFAARLVSDGETTLHALPRWLTSRSGGAGEERLRGLTIVAATLAREEHSGVDRVGALRHAVVAALLEHHPELTTDPELASDPSNRIARLQECGDRLGLPADFAVEFREHDLSLWRAGRRIAGRPLTAPADWSRAVEETLRSFAAPDEARRAVARIVEAVGLHLRGALLELADGRIAGVIDSVPGRPDQPRALIVARRRGPIFESVAPSVVDVDDSLVDEVILAHRLVV